MDPSRQVSDLPRFSPTVSRNIEIERDGFSIVRGVVPDFERETLLSALGPISNAGRRGLLATPVARALAQSAQFLALVRPHLSREPVPVRALYFDKSPRVNWSVAWHQDLTVAFRHRVELPGFGPWTVKDGSHHVQPPIELLEQMLALRLHLDDTDESNGALKVLPGTHRMGRISSERIRDSRNRQPVTVCTATAGDVVLMRPLLLHSSGKSVSPRHRRVLHIEYAGFRLPSELQWPESSRSNPEGMRFATSDDDAH